MYYLYEVEILFCPLHLFTQDYCMMFMIRFPNTKMSVFSILHISFTNNLNHYKGYHFLTKKQLRIFTTLNNNKMYIFCRQKHKRQGVSLHCERPILFIVVEIYGRCMFKSYSIDSLYFILVYKSCSILLVYTFSTSYHPAAKSPFSVVVAGFILKQCFYTVWI